MIVKIRGEDRKERYEKHEGHKDIMKVITTIQITAIS